MREDELMIMIGLMAVIGLITVAIFFLVTLQNTLKRVKPENQEMAPGQVWLMLIPIFNLVWQFIMIGKIADSLDAEFRDRGIDPGEDRPGYKIGIAYCSLNLCGFIPIIGAFLNLAGWVCWIVYWVKIAKFKNMLPEPGTQGYQDQTFESMDSF